MHVASLHIHPLKSCAVLDVNELTMEARGPAHDRRWLLVDAAGRFITARAEARIVLLQVVPHVSGLRVRAPTGDTIDIESPGGSARLRVRIWDDEVNAALADDPAHAWFSAYLGRAVRLVYMDGAACRLVEPGHGRKGDQVSFADGYPLLAISRGSLDGLNARLARPVPIARFRPNVFVEDGTAHGEDHWRRVRIGDVEFDAVKTCARCVFTTIDTATAARDPDGEPLATLRSYRRAADGDGILFGMNLIARGPGVLHKGDPIEVLEMRNSGTAKFLKCEILKLR